MSALRRTGPFPVEGDYVTAGDGSQWLFLDGRWSHISDGKECVYVNGRWELKRTDDEQRGRLLLALHVWDRARELCPSVRVAGPEVRGNDPLPTFVEMLARAALTDCIAEVCDGAPLGMLKHTIWQLEGLLRPSSHRRVISMLERQVRSVQNHPLLLAPVAGGQGDPRAS